MWTITFTRNSKEYTASFTSNSEFQTDSPSLEAMYLIKLDNPPILQATATGPSAELDLTVPHLVYVYVGGILFNDLDVKEWDTEGDYLWPLDETAASIVFKYVDYLREKRTEPSKENWTTIPELGIKLDPEDFLIYQQLTEEPLQDLDRLARREELRGRVIEFYNQCHDQDTGEFCEADYPGKPGTKAGVYDEYGRHITKSGELHGRRKVREVRVAGDVAYVPLSDDEHGPNAIVDADDVEIVNKYGWELNNDGHPYASIRGKSTPMHQLLTGEKNPDHINRDKLDHRRANLRTANKTLNEANTGPRKTNKSGYKGVSWDKVNNKWLAQIGYQEEGRNINKKLGRFNTPEEAAEAYNKKSKELHGDYAYQNIIPKEAE